MLNAQRAALLAAFLFALPLVRRPMKETPARPTIGWSTNSRASPAPSRTPNRW